MYDSVETTPPACQRIQALAERDPRRAVTLARRGAEHLGTEIPLLRAWAQYTLGWALLCWERFDAARPQLRDALAAFEAHAAHDAARRCSFALLLTDLTQFARPELEPTFASLSAQFAGAGAVYDSARCRLYQAVLLNVLGRPQEAEVVLRSIEHALARGPALDQGRWLRGRGIVAILLGEYSRAEDLLAQAAQCFRAARNQIELAKCWNQQAWAALQQEQLDRAQEYYQRAQQIFAWFDMPLQSAFSAKNIGFVYTRRGIFDLALRETLRALRQFQSLGRDSAVGECQLHLGNIYYYTAQWEAALACYTAAEQLFVPAGMTGLQLIAMRNRAIVYRNQDRYAEAHALLVHVEAYAQDQGNPAELAAVWHEQAELMADEGQIDTAIERYWQARHLFGEIGNLLGAADCAVEQGWLALRIGNLEEAQSHFEFATPLVNRHPHDIWRNQYGLARCAESRGDVQGALALYQAALTTVTGLRQRLASEAISSSLYIQAAQLHGDALHLAAVSGAAMAVVEVSEGQRALVLQRMLTERLTDLPLAYQADHERLRGELSALLSDSAADSRTLDAALAAYGELLLQSRHSTPAAGQEGDLVIDPFSLDRVRTALNRSYGGDWTALVYMRSGDTLLIGVLTPHDLIVEQTPYDANLQRLIALATQPLFRRYTYRDLPYLQGRNSHPWQTLRTLASHLLPRQAGKRLHPNHRLLIVPSGPLHALPWAALRIEDSWLAELAIVQIAPSLAVWPMLVERPSAAGDTALLVGCDSFGDRAPALPGVSAELMAVAERWPGASEQIRDSQASRAAVIERSASGELAHYSLLHFATHAQMLPARGLIAHLKLADGDLLLPEIAGLRLGGGLVVLSACEGATPDALPGEEILSLSWAFLVAGAVGVLASLWRIDDASAPRFMAAFYVALRDGRDASAALALAQRSMIAADTVEGVVPLGPECWGSFVLTGPGMPSRPDRAACSE